MIGSAAARPAAGPAPARRAPRLVLPALAAFAILRIPSFFEPHWYTDEGGYATTARAVMHGAALYSQAWTNKPPIQIWLVALPLRLFGPSEAGLHALTFLSGAIALAAVAHASARLLRGWAAWAAPLAFAAGIGLPAFDAQLVVPESLLMAPTAWAGAILVERLAEPARPRSGWWRWGWAPAAGLLTGVAIGIQQTCLGDAAAFALIMILSPRVRIREGAAFAAALVAVTLAWLLPSIAVAGADQVARSLVGFYRGYASFSAPSSPAGLALRAVGPAAVVVGAVLCRGEARPVWALWLWAAAVLEVAAVANRNYPHFLAPALAPGILALAGLPALLPAARLRAVPLVAGLAATSFFASVAWVESKAVDAYLHWPGAVATGRTAAWAMRLDGRGPSGEGAAAYLRAHGLAGSSAVVWSSDPWLYLVADLPLALPTAPIYNDVVLLGSGRAVAAEVGRIDPRVIVTTEGAVRQWPDIEALLASRYRAVHISGLDVVYLREDT